MKLIGYEHGLKILPPIIFNGRKPCLVSVSGLQNSGKTRLIEDLIKRLYDMRLSAVASEGYKPPTSPDEIRLPEFRCDAFIFHLPVRCASAFVDLSVAIYNPDLHPFPSCQYDFVIENPRSVEKYMTDLSNAPYV